MKKLSIALVVLALVLMSTSCSRVEAGYVGIKVNMLGSDKGVEDEVLGPGRYFITLNEALYTFPTFVQTKVWTDSTIEDSPIPEGFTFQTSEGLDVGADVSMTYQVDSEKVSVLFQNYRQGIEEITNVFLRTKVRDAFSAAASTRRVESLMGEGKEEFIAEVNTRVKEELDGSGIIVDKISIVNSLRLPKNITDSINLKAEATQKAEQREDELREAVAAAAIKKANAEGEAEAIIIKAEAEAEANRLLSQSLTNNLIMSKQIDKWDGKLPHVQGTDSGLMLNMN